MGVKECGGERERESVCVCVDVRNREVETRCDELRSKQDENEKRESDDKRTNTIQMWGGETRVYVGRENPCIVKLTTCI